MSSPKKCMNKPIKDLPYFKFFVGEYLSGRIQSYDMETQGIFVNICARAWKAHGYADNDSKLYRLLRVDKQVLANAIQLLLDEDMLVQNEQGNLSSKFILLQLSEFASLSKKRAAAGHKGGKAKQLAVHSNCKANLKQKGSILESEIEIEKEKDTDSVVLEIPLKNGALFGVTQAMVDEWIDLLPKMDVDVALKYVRQWNLDNPHKQKTLRGVRTHITGFLKRMDEQSQYRRTDSNPIMQQFTDDDRKEMIERDRKVAAEQRAAAEGALRE